MPSLAIIGAGKVGTVLGRALAGKGYRITALSSRHLASARESRNIIGQGEITMDNARAAAHAEWILIGVPDAEIENVARELSQSFLSWGDRFVFHCSGLLSSGVLAPLGRKGALTASIHPVRSFPSKQSDPAAFTGVYFGIEGEGKALNRAREIVELLGGRPFVLEAEAKTVYHAACSMASNYLVTLMDVSGRVLAEAGISGESPLRLLFPLAQETLQNVKNLGTGDALTGPIARGDTKSVRLHLEALQPYPEFLTLYKILGRQALLLADRQKSLPAETVRILKALLE